MFQEEAPRRRGTATLVAPSLRITTFRAEAPAPGYREIVAGLTAQVAQLPGTAVAVPTALPALRTALTDARWLVADQPEALGAALAALGATLDLLTDGAHVAPSQLGDELGLVVAAIGAAPPTRSLALGYALRHLVGVIGATCGQLLAQSRVPAPVPAPAEVVALSAEELADRRFADFLITATVGFGVAITGGMLALEVPEHAIASALVTLALATGWSLYRGRR